MPRTGTITTTCVLAAAPGAGPPARWAASSGMDHVSAEAIPAALDLVLRFLT